MPRINRAIELLEQGQPVYCDVVTELSHDSGVRQARTWADYLTVDLEHQPFDMPGLHAFMRGLVAGGPTGSGHRTPAVIVTLLMLLAAPDLRAAPRDIEVVAGPS